MDEIRVYHMNEYDSVASKWDVEETNDWYSKQYADNDIEDIVEADLDNQGMWMETEDKEDIKRLGDARELISEVGKPKSGDLILRVGVVCKWVTFREAIQQDLNFTEPYIIASTEW